MIPKWIKITEKTLPPEGKIFIGLHLAGVEVIGEDAVFIC